MVAALDHANLLLTLLTTIFDLIQASSELLTKTQLDPSHLWNVTYSFGSFFYWFSMNYVGEGAALDIMSENVTAMGYFADAVNYVGSNSTEIFGDFEGSRGMSKINMEMVNLIDENFAVELTKALLDAVNISMKIVLNVSEQLEVRS
ncbi:MAG: hypothetical protein ABWW66_07745 [Archaeoglobaceae archaeon]